MALNTSYPTYTDRAYNNSSNWKFSSVDKSLYTFYSVSNTYDYTICKYDIDLDTWTSIPVDIVVIRFDIGNDGFLYAFGTTKDSRQTINLYKVSQDGGSVTLVATGIAYLTSPTNMLTYSYKYSQFIGFVNKGDSLTKKIDILLKTISDVTKWGDNMFINNYSQATAYSDKICAVNSAQMISPSVSYAIPRVQYRDVSTETLTSIFQTYIDLFIYINNGVGGCFDAGFGKLVYPNTLSNLCTVWDSITRTSIALPNVTLSQKTLQGSDPKMIVPVAYDYIEGYLYFYYCWGSNQKFKRLKTGLNNFAVAEDAEFNFVIDFGFLLKIGLRVYLTITTENCYRKIESSDNYQELITNQRLEINEYLILKAPSTSLSGTLEITQ